MRVPIRLADVKDNSLLAGLDVALEHGSGVGRILGENYLIELQGTLTVDHDAERSGQLLGRLKICKDALQATDTATVDRKDVNVKPELIIGHHRLTGQIQRIDKPLLFLEKRVEEWTAEAEDTSGGGADTENRRTGLLSTPLKRVAGSGLSSSPGPRSEPDPAYQTYALQDYSSSPAASRGAQAAGEPLTRSKKVKVSYVVKGVLRQKIVFNTRPAPIIAGN